MVESAFVIASPCRNTYRTFVSLTALRNSFSMKKPALINIFAALLVVTSTSTANADECKEFKGVSAKVTVKADPEHVWHAIRSMRNDDPQDVKTISASPSEDILEETFDDLPIIGKAKCRYKERYKPYERIDYNMIESDHFKAFEGSWVLKPTGKGGETLVELSSYIDTGLTIPFAHQITNLATMRNVHKRLDEVKKSVETAQQRGGKQRLSEAAH